MKSFFSILLVACTLNLFAQTSNDDILKWNKYRHLTWNDFQAQPDPNTYMGAHTSVHLEYSYEVTAYGCTVTTYSYFNKYLSWTKFTDDAVLLHHEQGHFDIDEYYHRLFVKRIMNSRLTYRNANTMLSKIYKDICTEMKAMNEKYDKETDHGRNKDNQLLWNTFIPDMVNSLEEYDLPTVEVRFR